MGLTRNQVKLMAILLMLVDHIGLLLLNNNFLFRAVGRLSFPLFVFLLMDGFFCTRSVPRYARRLLLFWLISIVPYSLAMRGVLFMPEQNIFATLYLDLALFCVLDNENISAYAKFALALLIASTAEVIHTDYGWYGIAMAIVMFNFRKYGQAEAISDILPLTLLRSFGQGSMISVFACFAVAILPPDSEFRASERPGKALSLTMYLFYPVHLLFLASLTIF